MTTKPKARRFRIHRPDAARAEAPASDTRQADDTRPAPADAETPEMPPGPDQARPSDPGPDPDPGNAPATPPTEEVAGPHAAPQEPAHETALEEEEEDDAPRARSLAERRARTLKRLQGDGSDDAHPTRRPAPTLPENKGPTNPRRPRPEMAEDTPGARAPASEPGSRATEGAEGPHPRSLPPRQDRDAGRAEQSATPGPSRTDGGGDTDRLPETDLEAIRSEGLTGRQLRMARRVAQKHGLSPASDFDAVRMLRERGVDPFKRATMLDVVPKPGSDKALTDLRNERGTLPQPAPQDGARPPAPPGGGISPSDRRQREIMEIQRDIARRRRRKTLQLLTRLSFFVFLPTILAGYYYYVVATPMYAAKSEFLILQADATSGSPLGGLLSGTQFATNQDSIAVQSYLQSKDAMVRLDEDRGFKAHFTQDWIDPIQRMPDAPSNEDAYSVYEKFVKIGYDPTEGVIKMEVSAADPQTAAEFSTQLIDYAEQRVDELSLRKRDDAMKSARESLARAKEERREAQRRLVELQEGTLVDPEAVIGTLRTQISTYELQLQEKELQLAALMDNPSPNRARVAGVQADIDRLDALLTRLNGRMTEARSDGLSLAADTAQIQMAQADLATADLFLQSALQNEKQTELEANRQVRYLTTSVRPVAPEDPSYPRAFENTILVFLVLSGIYLMISLTGAILREQVSG